MKVVVGVGMKVMVGISTEFRGKIQEPLFLARAVCTPYYL